MIWRGRKRAASGQVGSHTRLTFWPARKDRMATYEANCSEPGCKNEVRRPETGKCEYHNGWIPPAPPDRPSAAMEGLQVYFLMRMQLKHCVDLAKAMDEPSQDVKHLAGSMHRAAQRFADTALEFAKLNGEK